MTCEMETYRLVVEVLAPKDIPLEELLYALGSDNRDVLILTVQVEEET